MAFGNTLGSKVNRVKFIFSRSPKKLHPSRAISEEAFGRYCPGGYHPVRIGDEFHSGKYTIVSKLGYGVYSTVWLACSRETKQHVALKILTADSFGHQKNTFERDILKHIKTQHINHPGQSHILGLLDEFEHHGPNGNHSCLVFKAMGPDLSEYRRLFPNLRIPIPLVKEISRQLLLALSHLHNTCQVIHTDQSHALIGEPGNKPISIGTYALMGIIDIKPQNILIESPAINKMFEQAPSEAFQPHDSPLEPPNDFYMASAQFSSHEEDIAHSTELSFRLTDFGTSSWFNKHLTEWIQPQMLRAPEVILGADRDSKVDIWNLGLIIWELAEGRLLFDGTWTANAPYSSEAHLAQINAVFGSIPEALLARSRYRDRYFDPDGKLIKPSTFPPCSLKQFSKNSGHSEAEKKKFLSFIGSMVRLDPEERPEAIKLLESEWLRLTP